MQGVSFVAIAGFPWGAAGIPPCVVDAGGDFAGFGHADAAQAPDDHDDLADEHFFERADRGEALMVGAAELFEFVGGFLLVVAMHDDLLGEKAVFQRVQAGDGFAVWGGWAGGAPGVAAVGGELFLSEKFFHKKRFFTFILTGMKSLP